MPNYIATLRHFVVVVVVFVVVVVVVIVFVAVDVGGRVCCYALFYPFGFNSGNYANSSIVM